MFYQALPCIVSVTICPCLICSIMIIDELHDALRMAIPAILEGLKDSNWRVRSTAMDVISRFAAHRKYYYPPPFDMLDHNYS